MQALKQSTIITIKLGPFLNKVDGVTEEVLLTPPVEVSKNGAAFAARNSVTAVSHDAEGYYAVELNATDTGTLGRLRVKSHDSTVHLPVWQEYMIMPANVWDSLFGADVLQVDLAQMGGVAQSATDLKDFADAGYDPLTKKVQGVALVDTVTTLTGHTPQTANHTAGIAAIPTVMRGTDGAALAVDYTPVRAAKLDNVDAAITSRQPAGNVTVGGYAAGQAPADGVLVAPGNKLATDVAGKVSVGVNSDKTGYSILGVKSTLDNLNDFDSLTQPVDVGKISGSVNAAYNLKATALAVVAAAAVAGTLSTV